MELIKIAHWIASNIVELTGTIFGLLYIYLSIRQNIAMWVVGFIASTFYIYIYFVSKFYADMGLQVYYLVISVYGFYYWFAKGKSQTDGKTNLPVQKLTLRMTLILSAITFVLFVAIAAILKQTDSPVPYWDSFTTAASITATWMITQKFIEQWLVWIVVDITSAILYVQKDLYSTTFLFSVYTILAIVGYVEWRKSFERQKSVLIN